ncbi:MAG: glyoxalase [Actinobacteria bacterium]|nr:glyoxalase [Actinomycetota bacterium]
MTGVNALVVETPDPAAAEAFAAALGVGDLITARPSDDPSSGFRGFTVSLVCSQPGNVDALVRAAEQAGATTLKPVKKSFWGYGGVVQAPDGSIWKFATSTKKDTAPATPAFDELVLLLGVEDVKATKQFYAERGLPVGKSFGAKYVEFATPGSGVKLALYGRRALAKDAGVAPEGSGSHRLVVVGDAGTFTDPDGFTWEAAA